MRDGDKVALGAIALLALAGAAQKRGSRNAAMWGDLPLRFANPYVSPSLRQLTSKQAEVRRVAYALKQGKAGEDHRLAGRQMAAVISDVANPILVPVPGSSGSTRVNRKLAEAIASHIEGATVCDELARHGGVQSSLKRRKRGLQSLGVPQHRMVSRGHCPGPMFLVDNVVTSGNTLRAAREAMGGGTGLVWAANFNPFKRGSRGELVDLGAQRERRAPDPDFVLQPPGQNPLIGEETGKARKNGIGTHRSPHGSVRYLMYEDGKIVSGLQVVSRDGLNALVAYVYTTPSHRRRGLASKLMKKARGDFQSVEHAKQEHLSQDAKAWIKGSPAKRPRRPRRRRSLSKGRNTKIAIAKQAREIARSELADCGVDLQSHQVGVCPYLAWAVIVAAHRAGRRLVLQAGSASWKMVPDHLDDGVSPNYFSYVWERDSPLTRTLLRRGNMLPEMHVWAADPKTHEVIDLSSRSIPRLANNAMGEGAWKMPQLPDYFWFKSGNPPAGIHYEPDRDATLVAGSYLEKAGYVLPGREP